MDDIRDRAFAQLDNEVLAVSAGRDMMKVPVTDEEYLALPALQRRELLAAALSASAARMGRREVPVEKGAEEGRVEGEVAVKTEVEVRGDRAGLQFWRVAESLNGRAAALGFVLCLAREIGEPGHPSLFEQVVDVVVPIAQSTPPFLVAVVDRIADLLT